MKIFRKIIFIYKKIYVHLIAFALGGHIKIGKNVYWGKRCKFIVRKNATLIIEDNVYIRDDCVIRIEKDGIVILSSNIFINDDCSINCHQRIIIGKNTLIGENVKLYDHNHKFSYSYIDPHNFNTGEIIIGYNCWICSGCILLKNTIIGNHTIIGANSIVECQITSHSIIKLNKIEKLRVE